MAKLELALEATLDHEGFYGNDSSDTGRETIWGIARYFNPKWVGWPIVDSLKNEDGFPACMKDNSELLEARDEFYTKAFWTPIKGDEIINQEVANDLFDKAVNMGIYQAMVLCQRSLDIPETGKMNSATLNVLNINNSFV